MPPVHPTFCAVAKLTAICQRGMTHVDRKDEIIQLQMDVISQMTQSNLRRIADDLWSGETCNPASAHSQPETAAPKREEEQPPPLKRWMTCAGNWKGTSALQPSSARWKA